jgi:lycopene cyclase domain-containing protein
MKFIYLAILIVSFLAITQIDYRYKLAFAYNLKATIKTVAIATSLLLFVDIIGINWHIFSTNQSYVIGLGLGSENIPIEEVVFLIFLNYFTLCTYRLILKRVRNV